MQFTVLEAGFLGVLVSWAAACSNEEAATCPHITSLIFSKLTFVDPGNIDAECSKYSELFACAGQYLGNCSLKSRLRWQPIAMQINDICNESKKAYVMTGSCWRDQEINTEVDVCNHNVQNAARAEMCMALDEFVTCCAVAAKTLCGAEAELVMHNLATTYVSLIRGTLCSTTQPPSTTTTTTATTATTTTTTTTTTTITGPQDDSLIRDTAEAIVSLSTTMTSGTAVREVHSGCCPTFDCKLIVFMIVCVVPFLTEPVYP